MYETDDALQLTSWTGDGPRAFSTVDTLTLTGPVVPTASGAAIDRFANTVASDVVSVDDTDIDIIVNAVDADAGFDADTYQLGTGDVGAELGTTVTFTNDGPASIGVASVTVDGTFTVRSESCTPVLRPGTTCSIEVGFTVEFLEDAFGTVTLTPVLGRSGSVPGRGQRHRAGTSRRHHHHHHDHGPGHDDRGSTTGGTTTGGTTTGGTTTGNQNDHRRTYDVDDGRSHHDLDHGWSHHVDDWRRTTTTTTTDLRRAPSSSARRRSTSHRRSSIPAVGPGWSRS